MDITTQVAKEVFQVLRSFDYDVVLYDENGNQVYEPDDARRFYSKKKNILVALISDNEDSSLRVYHPNGIDINTIIGLLDTLRTTATKYNLIFRDTEHGKDNINPKDFATKFSVSENKGNNMTNLTEGMYGTSRSSYLKLENARMVVRHSARVDESKFGARGRNIDAVFVENAIGERCRMPTNHLSPARAMANHVNYGGSWSDPVGMEIKEMAVDYGNLREAAQHIYRASNELNESAQEVRTKIKETLSNFRGVFEALCKKTRYDETAKYLDEKNRKLIEGEEVDYSGKVSELSEMLNTDSKSLSEAVLETVARFMEAEGVDGRFKMPDERKLELISVLGRPTNKAAWEEFKTNNKLDLMSAPTIGPAKFTDKNTKIAYYLHSIASVCKDDSMSNLLSRVSDKITQNPDPSMYKTYLIIANKAIKAAGLSLEESVANTPAVREFNEWMESFNTDNAIEEADYTSQEAGASDDAVDAAADDALNNFDVDTFIDNTNFYELEPVTSEVIKDQIGKYLNNYIHNHNEGMENVDLDFSGNAETMWKDVVTPLQDAGIEVSEDTNAPMEEDSMDGEDVMDEDTILSKEDVILPKNPSVDLMDEITPATVTDPDTGEQALPDDGYLQRLQTLAGVQARAQRGY